MASPERTERHMSLPMEAHVVVSRQSTRSQQDRMAVEATLTCAGMVLRGEERAPTIRAGVDALSDTLNRRVAQFKARLYRSEAARKHGRAGSI
jgi:ribosomal subunit interface protein